jgi:FMN phosphatase YigB (HAD superfamily)
MAHREQVIRETFQPFLKPQQEVPDALISELLKRYSSSEGYDMFPDARAFFDILRQARTQPSSTSPWRWEKTVVGVISNSDDRVHSVLSSLGLKVKPRRVGSKIRHVTETEDISFVVHSYDVGYEKPDRRIFNAATDMLASTLGSSEDYHKLYVGDSVSNDYVGAEKAGWHAVLIDRHGSKDRREQEVERKAPLETKSVEVDSGRMKKARVVHGLDELVNWHPKNKWFGERPGRSKPGDSSSSAEEA